MVVSIKNASGRDQWGIRHGVLRGIKGVSERVSEGMKVASKWYHRRIKRAGKGNQEASRGHQCGIYGGNKRVSS